jgi:hypothetical protein
MWFLFNSAQRDHKNTDVYLTGFRIDVELSPLFTLAFTGVITPQLEIKLQFPARSYIVIKPLWTLL